MKKILVIGSVVAGAASLAALVIMNRKTLLAEGKKRIAFRFAQYDPDVTPISYGNESPRFGGLE